MIHDLFSIAESRAARDQSLAQVSDNNETWGDRVLHRVSRLPAGWVGTGEDIRRMILDSPGHPNAWGAIINAAVKRGYLVKTGQYLQMKSKSSHARMTPEYRRS